MSQWSCLLALEFRGSETAKCQWADGGQRVIVSPNSGGSFDTSNLAVVGDAVRLSSVYRLQLRAHCPSTAEASFCASWPVADNASAVSLAASPAAVIPIAVLTTPDSLGPCSVRSIVLTLFYSILFPLFFRSTTQKLRGNLHGLQSL